MPGSDDDVWRRLEPTGRRQDLEAVHVGEVQVQDDDVDRLDSVFSAAFPVWATRVANPSPSRNSLASAASPSSSSTSRTTDCPRSVSKHPLGSSRFSGG
jgi:hypothetical protein